MCWRNRNVDVGGDPAAHGDVRLLRVVSEAVADGLRVRVVRQGLADVVAVELVERMVTTR